MYKLGTKVIIREDVSEETTGINDIFLMIYRGKIATIITKQENYERYTLDIDNQKFIWAEEWLDFYNEPNSKFIIKCATCGSYNCSVAHNSELKSVYLLCENCNSTQEL